jgi:hypothetical protein
LPSVLFVIGVRTRQEDAARNVCYDPVESHAQTALFADTVLGDSAQLTVLRAEAAAENRNARIPPGDRG